VAPTRPAAPTTTVAPTTTLPAAPILVHVVTPSDNDRSIRDWFRSNGLNSLYEANKRALQVPPLVPGTTITVVAGRLVIIPR
jgi:hypothetical protein